MIQRIICELISVWNTSPTFYVATISAIVAFLAYKNTKKQNVFKNTLDFQTHWNDSVRVDEAWLIFQDMVMQRNERISVADAAESKNSSTEESKALREILNRLECAAAAISNGIYDEPMLRKNYSGAWLKMWCKVYEDYICKRRKIADNPRIYDQLEVMFDRWQRLREEEDAKLRDNGKKTKFKAN